MKRQWNAEEMKEAARDARRALERGSRDGSLFQPKGQV